MWTVDVTWVRVRVGKLCLGAMMFGDWTPAVDLDETLGAHAQLVADGGDALIQRKQVLIYAGPPFAMAL